VRALLPKAEGGHSHLYPQTPASNPLRIGGCAYGATPSIGAAGSRSAPAPRVTTATRLALAAFALASVHQSARSELRELSVRALVESDVGEQYAPQPVQCI